MLEHMTTTHYRLEIERTFMTRSDAVWSLTSNCPFCGEKVEEWEVFIKHVGVKHRAVEQFIPEKFRFPSETFSTTASVVANSHLCLLPDCTRRFVSERTLLVHMVMSHFYKQMEDMFEHKFLQDKSTCFKCGKTLPSNKVGFMKHIGVDHGVVKDLAAGTFHRDEFLGVPVKKERNIL